MERASHLGLITRSGEHGQSGIGCDEPHPRVDLGSGRATGVDPKSAREADREESAQPPSVAAGERTTAFDEPVLACKRRLMGRIRLPLQTFLP